ncbi:Sec-independent protein translocase protein TatB [Vogesella amnigena]|uniref:Sec-independent protein translocase protein TatB n=1 Tax=Vogesella amnigena TaxID=1507449 RepID=A0ABV7TXR8_9NEIS
MFEISFGELLIIGAVALVVLGPERLPAVARTIGALVGRAQRFVASVKSDIQQQSQLAGLQELQQEMRDAAHSFRSQVEGEVEQVRQVAQQIEQQAQQVEQQAAAVDPAALLAAADEGHSIAPPGQDAAPHSDEPVRKDDSQLDLFDAPPAAAAPPVTDNRS